MKVSDNHGARIGFDDEGEGEPVILLHSACSSRRQWRVLKDQLIGRYRVLAVDLLGYGDTGLPAGTETFRLEQEIELVEHLMQRIDGPFHVVGHSYGAVIGMQIALRHGERVRSFRGHEPVVFGLLRTAGFQEEWDEIERLGEEVLRDVKAGENEKAAERFIDYWGGTGTWSSTPERGKPYLLRSIEKVALEFGTVLTLDEPLSAYSDLSVPVLLTAGTTGPLPARRVAEVLGQAFGEGSLRVIAGAGHMAPITQPDKVNPHIIAHLAAHPIS